MTTTTLDPQHFVYALDGAVRTGAPNYWPTGEVWWLYETAQPSVYVVIVGPRMEVDGDEGGTWWYPEYDAVLVISPDGERPANDDESEEWEAWRRAAIREGCHE